MATFNAVAIEHTMARFFGGETGERGTFWDAGIFRGGDPQEMAEILRLVADRLEARTGFIKFPDHPKSPAKAYVETCIMWLRRAAGDLAQRTEFEPENYHWEIFGALMSGIEGLLESLEGEGTVN